MRIRTAAVGVALLATLVACGKSEADQQADCQKAINAESTKTNRPDACKDLSQDDYDTLLMAYALENAVKDLPEDTQDLLDHSDDGELNDSIIGTED
ncbi:hypothetical protein SUDANB145_07177 (plasmid) [Streptomyces sp. enrichment culture]|uniref:hypothetical protein n=1 Tax=Streptomyces sp. enrichment culture TaxID=1795815 RepID=UPI003F547F40